MQQLLFPVLIVLALAGAGGYYYSTQQGAPAAPVTVHQSAPEAPVMVEPNEVGDTPSRAGVPDAHEPHAVLLCSKITNKLDPVTVTCKDASGQVDAYDPVMHECEVGYYRVRLLDDVTSECIPIPPPTPVLSNLDMCITSEGGDPSNPDPTLLQACKNALANMGY